VASLSIGITTNAPLSQALCLMQDTEAAGRISLCVAMP
jgi:hypothetical protein